MIFITGATGFVGKLQPDDFIGFGVDEALFEMELGNLVFVGEDHHGDQALCLLSQNVGGELDQVLSHLHRLTHLNQRFEAFAFQLHRVDPDVNQNLYTLTGLHSHRVAGGVHLHNRS